MFLSITFLFFFFFAFNSFIHAFGLHSRSGIVWRGSEGLVEYFHNREVFVSSCSADCRMVQDAPFEEIELHSFPNLSLALVWSVSSVCTVHKSHILYSMSRLAAGVIITLGVSSL